MWETVSYDTVSVSFETGELQRRVHKKCPEEHRAFWRVIIVGILQLPTRQVLEFDHGNENARYTAKSQWTMPAFTTQFRGR